MNRKLICTLAVLCVAIVAATTFVGLASVSQPDDRDASRDQIETGDVAEDSALGSAYDGRTGDKYDFFSSYLGYKINKDGNTVTVTSCYVGNSSFYVPDEVTHDGKTYTVTRIGFQVFQLPKNVAPTSISIGASIQVIEDSAFRAEFRSDGYLETFTIRNIGLSQLREIGMDAFRSQKSLTNVELPASLTLIKNSAFRECESLKTVTLHSKNLEIRESAFRNCHQLEKINLEGVTKLGNGAFHECNSLKVADLSSIQSLAQTSFRNCPLEKVVIGDNLNSIRGDSFHKTVFYDGNGNALKVNVENLRNHAFEMNGGKLVMVS